jgi:hypothetical protein
MAYGFDRLKKTVQKCVQVLFASHRGHVCPSETSVFSKQINESVSIHRINFAIHFYDKVIGSHIL